MPTFSGFLRVTVLISLLGGALSAQSSGTPDALRKRIDALTETLRSGAASPAVRRERADALYDLIALDPAAAIAAARLANPSGAPGLPLSADSDVLEENVGLQGDLRSLIADDFRRRRSKTLWRFRSGARDHAVFFAGTAPEIRCETPARLEGIRLRDRIAVSSVHVQVAQLFSCSTMGNQQTAVLLVSMPSAPLSGDITASSVSESFFGSSGRTLNRYWNEVSYGLTSAGGSVFGPLTLDADYTCEQLDEISSAALKAFDATVDFTLFSRIFIVLPSLQGDCGWAGVGVIGCGRQYSALHGQFQASISWIQLAANDPDYLVPVAIHEGGHNLGLGHAASVDFGNIPLGPINEEGEWTEYGDLFSTMGLAYAYGHYAAPHKDLLHWFPPGAVSDVQSNGRFTIAPYEMTASGPQVLRIPRGLGSPQKFWVEYRQNLGEFDTAFVYDLARAFNGALIHYQDDPRVDAYPLHTRLLTFNPVAKPNDFTSAAMIPGSRWSDPYSNLSLSVSSASPSGLEISVNFDGAVFGDPASVELTWNQGQPGGPANVPIQLRSTGQAYGISAAVQSDGNWLSLVHADSSTPGVVEIGASAATLLAGTYRGSITITAGGSPNSPIVIPVTLQIVPHPKSPIAVSVSPGTASGSGQTFYMVVRDPVTYKDLKYADLVIASGTSPAASCYVRYDGASRMFTLRADDGSTSAGTVAPGASAIAENSQCALSGSGSFASGTDGNLTVAVALGFKAPFAGVRTIYGITENSFFPTGWQALGSFTITQTPSVVSVNPSQGTGLNQKFSFVYSNPLGSSDFDWVGADFSLEGSTWVHTCAFYSFAPFNVLGLWDDEGANVNWLWAGSGLEVHNTVCTIKDTGSFGWLQGNIANLEVSVSFNPAAAGTRNIYVYGSGQTQYISTVQAGSWFISGTASAPAIGGVAGAGLSITPVTSLSPSGIFSIFGSAFTLPGLGRAVDASDTANGSLPTKLAETCVEVAGVRAPLFYVSETQINAQLPDLQPGTHNISVTSGCETTNPQVAEIAVTVEAATPEFFHFGTTDDRMDAVAAVNASTGQLIGPEGLLPGVSLIPARAGDIISVFATGLGPVSPPLTPGKLATSANPVAGIVSLSLAGVPIAPEDLLYAGTAPYFAGLYQINFRVPAGVPAGRQPLIVSVDGKSSPPTAVLAIQM